MTNAAGMLGRFVLLVGFIAAAMILGAGPLYRFAHIDLGLAFTGLKYGSYAAIGTGVLAVIWLIVALVSRSAQGLMFVILGLVLAGSIYVPLKMKSTAESVPAIHDITTDTANPPVFVALMDARKAAANGADYDATNVPEQQKAFADIQPFLSDKPPADVFAKAKKVATDMGWEIVAAEPSDGRIEATDTTMWFGFKDDVVIRIAAAGTGSKLDIRSMSRVGKSDLGKNAARIREFLTRLKSA
jgi:uncharacterized protein (DUF1499 family)